MSGDDHSAGAGIIIGCPYAFANQFKGVVCRERGEYERSDELFDTALRIAAEQGDPETESWTRGQKAMLLSIRGEADGGLALAQRNYELAERLGDVFSRTWALVSLSLVRIANGRFRRGARRDRARGAPLPGGDEERRRSRGLAARGARAGAARGRASSRSARGGRARRHHRSRSRHALVAAAFASRPGTSPGRRRRRGERPRGVRRGSGGRSRNRAPGWSSTRSRPTGTRRRWERPRSGSRRVPEARQEAADPGGPVAGRARRGRGCRKGSSTSRTWTSNATIPPESRRERARSGPAARSPPRRSP